MLRKAGPARGLSHDRLVGQEIKAKSSLSLTPEREPVTDSEDALKDQE